MACRRSNIIPPPHGVPIRYSAAHTPVHPSYGFARRLRCTLPSTPTGVTSIFTLRRCCCRSGTAQPLLIELQVVPPRQEPAVHFSRSEVTGCHYNRYTSPPPPSRHITRPICSLIRLPATIAALLRPLFVIYSAPAFVFHHPSECDGA
jgi:hypothetical protein